MILKPSCRPLRSPSWRQENRCNSHSSLKGRLSVVLVSLLPVLSGSLSAENPLFVSKFIVESQDEAKAITKIQGEPDSWFIDFGQAAFGTIKFQATASDNNQVVTVHLGERVHEDGTRINRTPPGTQRYRAMKQPLKEGTHWYRVEITPDRRNTRTSKGAVLMPKEIGEVMPFRYCELEGYPGQLESADIIQTRAHYPFDDEAAHFESSNELLNQIWELCKYSIKATSFTGVYVDGDRERIPYEADAYINQLAHYSLDTEYAMGRRTLDYFWENATWPVEWHQHIPIMVWEEYLYTGDLSYIEENYDKIVGKLLLPMAREDGLLSAPNGRKDTSTMLDEPFLNSIGMSQNSGFRIIIDWPAKERDRHAIKNVDSVVNAFHYNNLLLVSRMAEDLGKTGDAKKFKDEAARVKGAYQQVFFKKNEGIYRDGEGTNHSSLHANFFPLTFGLVPEDKQQKVLDFVQSKGMACSVYGSQHLLDGLYASGADDYALSLLTSTGKRSWANMINVGSTITLEAWDNEFKPNQDWNHAWGAAPANLIPRRLMGVMPIEPGFEKVRIQPQVGPLEYAELKQPTLLGPIFIKFQRTHGEGVYNVSIPGGMSAEVILDGYEDAIEIPAGNERQAQSFRAKMN